MESRTHTESCAGDTPPVSERPAPAPPAPPASAPPPLDGFIKHYEIVRTLGVGGMGSVLLARDTKLGRLVAIKLLHDDGHAGARLLDEAQFTARARHENIVVIYEIGAVDGRPYMVLEYLEGRTLRRVISSSPGGEGRALPRGLTLDIMASVVRALAAAHKSGIVHRDLKPENIMLLDAGQVKVLDFGIARPAGADERRRREGTRAYMSPEQWRGDEIDARSDLWAAGVILYELLAGAHPLAPLTAGRLAQVTDRETPMPRLADARPELAGLSKIVERCLRKKKEERFASADELLAALEPWITRSRAPSIAEGVCPFAGLAAFQESDADHFFGRERDVVAVLGTLGRQALVAVAGPSGAGKSSFVRAGVIPALRRSGEDWDVLWVRPGRAPLAALREALAPEAVDGDLGEKPALFGALLRAWCRAKGSSSRLLVFVDQLEELHTLAPDAAERAAFLACLLGAADDASSPLRVVVCVRSDYLDRIAEDRPFMAQVGAGLFFLPPVGEEGLREALTQPVMAAGYRFESEVMIADMLEELSRAKSPLPLLQFSATALWEARDRQQKMLTRVAYERMGGVGGALARHADEVVSGLSAPDQRLCRAIALRLVTPERTRAITTLRELVALGEEPAAVEAIVSRLVAARLLLVDTDAEQGSAKVELVHEALIERWPTLSRWLDENAGDARLLSRLRAVASQWHADGEPTGMLWRDRAAEEARAFLERHRRAPAEAPGARIGPLEERYLRAVISLADQDRRRRNRTLAGAFALVCAVAGVVLVLGLDARTQARRADEEAARVREQNAELALQALRGRNATRILAARKREDDPTVALALLREIEPPDLPREWPELVSAALSTGVARDVWRTSPTRVAYAAVTSPDGTRIAVAMDDHTTRILGDDLVERALLRGHEKLVWSVDWSPDGARVVTASFDGTARIWFADGSGEPLVLRGHGDMVNTARMSPDGRRVVTASDDRTSRVWSADDGRELLVLRHETEVQSAAWSPDGERIVTASLDGVARVWNTNGKGEPTLLRGHSDMVVAASFHPDGTRIATAGRDRTVRVWSAQGAELLVLRGHEEKVLSVAWSPDGARLASASKDKTARVWRADGRGSPIVLRGHGHWVYTATFSPDGERIVTTSLDGTQRRFHLGDIVAPTLLRGHEDTIRGLVFSPDGKRIATASFDGTTRIWNADGAGESEVLRGHSSEVRFVRWSPDGARLATASEDKTARVWTVDGSAAPIVLRAPGGAFQMLDWSPDGERLVTASLDGTIGLWSKRGVELGSVTKRTRDEFKWIRAFFDPSGKRVLVMDTTDSTVWLWDVDERGELSPLGHHESTVRFAKWSPDGSRVLTISNEGVARIWDTRGEAPPVEIRGPKAIFNGFFGPDGRRLILAFADGTLRPWSGDGLGAPIAAGAPEEGGINGSFSVDGSRVLTSALDGKVRVRNVDGSGAPFVLESATLALSNATWSPGGDRIAVHYEDKFAWVWPDVRPFSGPDDARLWTATSYCTPPALRVELLGVTEAEAREGEEACRRRVAITSTSDTTRRGSRAIIAPP
ncbi:protein kinase domain-containing protein [Polyangium spumosum]|nr:protein kinase [Polyangium spumosum]